MGKFLWKYRKVQTPLKDREINKGVVVGVVEKTTQVVFLTHLLSKKGVGVKEENNRVCLKVEAVYTHLLEAYSSLRYLWKYSLEIMYYDVGAEIKE